MIYFTRHGKFTSDSGSDKGLSFVGGIEITKVQNKLVTFNFKPDTAISSPTQRCVDTACLLTESDPESCVTLDKLLAFGPFDRLYESADIILDAVMSEIPENENAVVVCHDSMAAVLAMLLAERRGKKIDWQNIPYHLFHLKPGHGLLVDGINFVFVGPYTK